MKDVVSSQSQPHWAQEPRRGWGSAEINLIFCHMMPPKILFIFVNLQLTIRLDASLPHTAPQGL